MYKLYFPIFKKYILRFTLYSVRPKDQKIRSLPDLKVDLDDQLFVCRARDQLTDVIKVATK